MNDSMGPLLLEVVLVMFEVRLVGLFELLLDDSQIDHDRLQIARLTVGNGITHHCLGNF